MRKIKWTLFILGCLFFFPLSICVAGTDSTRIDSAAMHLLEKQARISSQISEVHTELSNQIYSLQISLYITIALLVGLMCLVVFYYKKIETNLKKLSTMVEKSSDAKSSVSDTAPQIVWNMNEVGTSAPTLSGTNKQQSVKRQAPVESRPSPVKQVSPKKEPLVPIKKGTIAVGDKIETRYASIQESSQGGLQIAERVLTDKPEGKSFVVHINYTKNTATYTFNPSSRSAILADLQTFKKFAEPFTISGNPVDILTLHEGTLKKDGKYWIVIKKVQVDFKY